MMAFFIAAKVGTDFRFYIQDFMFLATDQE